MNLRKAKIDEVDVLNKLAYQSESYWGEDQDYMDSFRKEYSLTANMICNNDVYIMENNGKTIGFFAILRNDDTFELELFYIERTLIGKGYGSIMWRKMIELCKKKEIKKFVLVGSNDVSDFYKKLGAIEIERKESLLKSGRIVSKFEYEIK